MVRDSIVDAYACVRFSLIKLTPSEIGRPDKPRTCLECGALGLAWQSTFPIPLVEDAAPDYEGLQLGRAVRLRRAPHENISRHAQRRVGIGSWACLLEPSCGQGQYCYVRFSASLLSGGFFTSSRVRPELHDCTVAT